MKVALLSIEQKNQLLELKYDNEQFFNPIQDYNDNWIISIEEIKFCTNKKNIEWIYNLQFIDYYPKIYESNTFI